MAFDSENLNVKLISSNCTFLSDSISDIGIPNINEMRKDQSEFNSFQAPGVEMHCLYGSHIDTADR